MTQYPLALTTLFMGLAGGPHCIAMCGAACASLEKGQGGAYDLYKFHAGRLVGYASLGALAAASVNSLAWFSSQTLALHPIWTFFHVLVFCWGLLLLAYARQPAWADLAGQRVWAQVRKLSNLPGGVGMTGILWALMPCGLLYSALLVASLSANALNGAFCMATFAAGTSVSLMVGPLLWLKFKNGSKWMGDVISMRLAGLLLATVAGWAVWMDVVHQVKIWCN
jgi:uncharacterized protein